VTPDFLSPSVSMCATFESAASYIALLLRCMSPMARLRDAIAHGTISRAFKAAKGLPGLLRRNAGDQNRGDSRPSVPALRSYHHYRATTGKD